MSSIGDLFMRVLAEMDGFEASVVKEAEKTGDKAGLTLGQRMGAGIKANGVKAIGVAVAAGLAIAAKGANELANIQADFQSQTGASADEAEAAAKTINRVAGEQRQSLESVSNAAVIVRRDLGLMGKDADAALDTIVRFARVTGQDAVSAAKAFDDILDSWGLSAKDLSITMDKLLVSQHKFGGDINETEKTLAALAPAMRAANMSIDDGIALLGLFGAKGLDAETASAAFAKALTKVKSPKELQDVIKDIETTTDPFLRAAKAADLFGARAGAKLANALGEANLDDYKISMDEAAGATEKAADVIDSTVSARIAKAFSIASAQLREFGAGFGPAITGIASLATVAGALGGGKLISKFTGPLLGLAAKGKTLIVNAILSWIVPAHIAGEAVGIAQAEGMAEGMAGAQSMSIAQRALAPIGKIWGSILGKSFVLGALAVIGVELYDQLQKLNEQNKSQINDIGVSVGKEISDGTLEGLQQTRGALEKGIADLDLMQGLFGGDARNATVAMQKQLKEVNAAIIQKTMEGDEAVRRARYDGGQAGVDAYIAGMKSKQAEAAKAAQQVVRDSLDFDAAVKEGLDAGGAVVSAYAKGILTEQQKVGDAFQALLTQQKEELTPAQEQAKIIGELTSKELAAGLKDGRPGVRLAAEEVQRVGLERLGEIVKAGKPLGKKASAELAAGLKSKDPAVRAAANHVKDLVHEKLHPVIADSRSIAQKAAAAFAAAWKVQLGALQNMHLSVTFKGSGGFAEGGRPPLHVASWVGEKGRELFVPDVPGTVVPHGLSEAMVGGGPTINLTVQAVPGMSLLDTRRQGQIILDTVADGLREQTARSA